MMRWLVIAVVVIAALPLRSDPAAPQVKSARRQTARPSCNIRDHKPVDEHATPVPFDRSIVNERRTTGYSSRASSAAPPPPSPGIPIGYTAYDYQHNQSQMYQVARTPGVDIVHFVWQDYFIFWCNLDCPDRLVVYSAFDLSEGQVVAQEILTDEFDRGGYANIATDGENRAHIFLHKRTAVSPDPPYPPYHSWHYRLPFPGGITSLEYTELSGTEPECAEVIWPHGTAARDAVADGVPAHVLSHSGNPCDNDFVWYWRYNGTTWDGPVIIDSSSTVGYVVADDPNSDKVALVIHTDREPQFNGLNNIAYYESADGGLSFLDGTALGDANKILVTNYNDLNAPDPQAWYHISTAYDNSGVLNIVWDEQRFANLTTNIAIKHWNDDRQTIRTVAQGYWGDWVSGGYFNFSLAKVTLGIGDGSTSCNLGATSNQDYLYVLYTRFGGPTVEEQEDVSIQGHYNGELYLNVSTDGGMTWSPPQNLTNTKTPDCNPGEGDPAYGGLPPRPDSVCRSENWATIGQVVSDIDIFFISDLDAGGIPVGEGTWQNNPVHYLRLPGGTTDAPYVCPYRAPQMTAIIDFDPECEYHTAPGTIEDENQLTIGNIGNDTLDVTITVLPGAPWLSVSGPASFSILPAGADVVRNVVMDATALSDGVYNGTLRVTHNDSTQPSPLDFPIDFFVFDNFYCPEDEYIATAMNPGVLFLEVQSGGRFGAQNPEGGLWRRIDSSSSIYDGSLLIAHGPQDPDTVVFYDLYDDNSDPGSNGFVALSALVINDDAAGTGQGYASASCRMATKDSVVGVDVDWIFPQHLDSADFVLAHYRVHNRTSIPTEILIGQWVDFDVLPAARLAGLQDSNENNAFYNSTWNLVYQFGAALPVQPPPAGTAARYSAGLTYIAGVDRIPQFNRPLGAHLLEYPNYPSSEDSRSEFIYSLLSDWQGYNWCNQSGLCFDSDQYCLIAFDQHRALGADDTLHYLLALMSDTLSNPGHSFDESTSLNATVRKAWHYAQANGFVCRCDCHADPVCDGVTSILDVVGIIDRAFRAADMTTDPTCYAYGASADGRTDVNCNNSTDILDVVLAIDVCFRNGDPAAKFCALCEI